MLQKCSRNSVETVKLRAKHTVKLLDITLIGLDFVKHNSCRMSFTQQNSDNEIQSSTRAAFLVLLVCSSQVEENSENSHFHDAMLLFV